MKKTPTDFSQITLLSNQKAKLIYQKNSKESNEHGKLCKSFEIAKHGIKMTHGKKKKDLEKRLERHYQDSLNVDDIKSLRKYVGDARDENEFYIQFIDSGRTRRTKGSSVLSDKKGHAMTREMSKLEARNNFIIDLGKDMDFVLQDQSKLQKVSQDNAHHSMDVSRPREEWEMNSVTFAKGGKVDHSNHSRTQAEETTDGESCKTWSPKVQRENMARNHKAGEMLSGSTVSSALQTNIVTSHPKVDPVESSRAVNGAAEGEKRDQNNNCFEGKTCSQEDNGTIISDFENQETKMRQIQAATVEQSSAKVNLESKEPSDRSASSQQRLGKDSKKAHVILARLGPTPDECDEEVDEETLQDEKDSVAERQYLRQRKSSLTIVNCDMNLMQKSKEMFPASNNLPGRRRRSSWAGPHSVTERLFKRELLESLPQINRNFETESGVVRSDFDRDRASQKSFDPTSNDALDFANTTGKRRHGFESLEALKREFFHQKSNSVPLGLGSKVKVYSEEPFYMRPRRLSRRPSWQSIHLSEETLQGLREIADKAGDNETMNKPEPEPETPLVSILPPITLQSIYAQQCSREKREQELQDIRKQRGTHKKIGEEKQTDLSSLTDRLKDCRYLRHRKDPGL